MYIQLNIQLYVYIYIHIYMYIYNVHTYQYFVYAYIYILHIYMSHYIPIKLNPTKSHEIPFKSQQFLKTLHGHHGRQLPILTREEVPVQCWTATKASSSDNSHEITTVFLIFWATPEKNQASKMRIWQTTMWWCGFRWDVCLVGEQNWQI